MQGQFIFAGLTAGFCSLFSSDLARAQPNQTDSVFYQSALSSAVHFFVESQGDQLGLYNGPYYPAYPFTFKNGNPYFQSDQFSPGSIYYDGILYTDVPLLYDQVKDALIIQGKEYPIQLDSKKLAGFTVYDHLFVWFDRNDTKEAKTEEGFYELISNGRLSVLKKETKKLSGDLLGADGLERSVAISYHYFIKTNNILYPVNNTRDLIRLFIDKQKEITQFLKDKNLKFQKDPESTLLKTSSYYEQLTGQ